MNGHPELRAGGAEMLQCRRERILGEGLGIKAVCYCWVGHDLHICDQGLRRKSFYFVLQLIYP